VKTRASTWGGMVFFAGSCALAETPNVEGIFPAGGQRGTEFEVSVTGKFEPWPLQARCDDPRIVFSPSEKDKGKFRVTIGQEVEPGASLVRFFNREGATVPRQFVVGALPERTQVGADTMAIPLGDFPLTVNGKLAEGGEVDRFSFDLQEGQVLVAAVTAYALDSPLDPLLHMRGLRGEQLAFNHDANRLGLDPRLVFKAPAAGKYELHLSAFVHPPKADIRFAGSEKSIYRMSLGHDPPVIELPPPHEAAGEDAQRVEIPAVVSGTIDPPGDIDRYLFSAQKDEKLHLEIAAAKLGSWMDPVLVIKDAAGKELKREDDSDAKPRHDVMLDWTAPAEGDFTAEITDLNGVGGNQMVYRFRVTKPVPVLEATASGGVYAIARGKKLEIAVKVTRRYGFEGELQVTAESLPPGVTAAPAAVSDKGEAKLTLEATPDAAPANLPISIWAGPKGANDKRVPCRFELKGAAATAGGLLINQTECGWLTVLEKEIEKEKQK